MTVWLAEDIVAMRWVVRDNAAPSHVLQQGRRKVVTYGDGRTEQDVDWQDVPTESET